MSPEYVRGEFDDLVAQIAKDLGDVYDAAGVLMLISCGNKRIDGRRPADAIRERNLDDLRVLARWAASLADGNFA